LNTKNLLIASGIGAVVTTILSNTPILNLVNCLLCTGFWGGSILAVWFYKRQSGSVTLGQAVWVGTLTGLFAGILGFLLSFVGMAGAAGLLSSYSQFLPADASAEIGNSLAGVMSLVFNVFGVMTNIILGTLGGLISGAIFKTKAQPAQ
jgi:hypothetical protein